MEARETVKYEVVVGVPDDIFYESTNRVLMTTHWQRYADEYFEKTGVYVSAIANDGKALYKVEWGCPVCGEPVITFNCTANPEFIKDMDLYDAGVLYIAKNLKKNFKQNTVTITKLPAGIYYLTNDNMEE